MTAVVGMVREAGVLLNEMAPYLLFGYLFAGILHIFLQPQTIARQLGSSSFDSVLKASLFGIPLPLCSCGVIPAALSLRKEGASKGAVLSFLISTPTTGIDSIFATFALLGGLFAIYRVGAAFVAAFCVGILANVFIRDDSVGISKEPKNACRMCKDDHDHQHTLRDKIKRVFTYAFGDLLGESGIWLLVGILMGGIISYFMPEEFIQRYVGSGVRAISIMFIVGIPMYVCASGSIPIAAALLLKGLNPGAAFAFLLAGPATNTVTITVVGKNLGRRALVIYLLTIVACSLLLGLLLDYLWNVMGEFTPAEIGHHRVIIPAWFKVSASVVLVILIAATVIRSHFFKSDPQKVCLPR